MHARILHTAHGIITQPMVAHCRIPHGNILRFTDSGYLQSILFPDEGIDFIVDLQKGFGILRMHGKLHDVQHIQHRAVGKKGNFRIPHTVRNFLPLQQINQRKGALVVPVKHRHSMGGARSDFGHVAGHAAACSACCHVV